MQGEITGVDFHCGETATLCVQIGEQASFTVSKDTVAALARILTVEQLQAVVDKSEQLIAENIVYDHIDFRKIVAGLKNMLSNIRKAKTAQA